MTATTKVNLSIDGPDLEEGTKFYNAVFGFIETARPLPTMAVLDATNLMLCIYIAKTGSGTLPSLQVQTGLPRPVTAGWCI